MRGYRAWFGAVFSILVLGAAVEAAAQSWPLPVPKNIAIQSAADFHGVLILWNKKIYQIDQVTWCISPTGELGIGSFRGYDENGQVLERSGSGGCMRSPHWASDFTDFIMGRPQDGERRVKVRSARFATNNQGLLYYSSIDGVRGISQETYSTSSQSCNNITTLVCRSINCSGGCQDVGACYCQSGFGTCESVVGEPECPVAGYCPGTFERCYKKNGGTCGCYVPDYPDPNPSPEPSPSPAPIDPSPSPKPKELQPRPNPE